MRWKADDPCDAEDAGEQGAYIPAAAKRSPGMMDQAIAHGHREEDCGEADAREEQPRVIAEKERGQRPQVFIPSSV